MLIRVAPSPVSASRKPMTPGTTSATHGVLRLPVTESNLGKYPARLRACANRSRSSGRSVFPAVVNPGFSDQSPHNDDRVGKGDPEVDDLPLALGTPQELSVGITPGVGSFYDPPFRRPERVRGAFLGDCALQPAFVQQIADHV